jgi:hypothetical protein
LTLISCLTKKNRKKGEHFYGHCALLLEKQIVFYLYFFNFIIMFTGKILKNKKSKMFKLCKIKIKFTDQIHKQKITFFLFSCCVLINNNFSGK